jgi:hypothetical protein
MVHRRRTRRGGMGFDASEATGTESAFMKGKRLEDEAEAKRLGQIASTKRKRVSEALKKEGRYGKGGRRHTKRKHTRRRR